MDLLNWRRTLNFFADRGGATRRFMCWLEGWDGDSSRDQAPAMANTRTATNPANSVNAIGLTVLISHIAQPSTAKKINSGTNKQKPVDKCWIGVSFDLFSACRLSDLTLHFL